LFDAVSSLCGVSQESSYEGESAMLLEETAAAQNDEFYPVPVIRDHAPWQIDTRPMTAQIASEIASGRTPALVSRCFHNSVAHMMEEVCIGIRESSTVDKVCLSGGAFQNFTLLACASERLRRSGFQVFLHSKVPPNDGGLSLGQAVIAAAYLEKI
jgi:hydrogenase maturation protein HypF